MPPLLPFGPHFFLGRQERRPSYHAALSSFVADRSGGIPAAEELTCYEQADLLSWPSGMTALLPCGTHLKKEQSREGLLPCIAKI